MFSSLHPAERVIKLRCFKKQALHQARKLQDIDKIASQSFKIKAAVIDRKLRALTVNKL